MRRSRHIVAAFIATYAALAGATALLGSVHGQLQASRMSRHLERAEALVAAHDLEAGIVQYHAVLELERDNAAARRGLALTLLSLERWAEAESYVRDLLQEDPTDGVLNRALARIQAARGEEEEARRAYQRAIYGQWPATAADERITARFELIEYLRRVARPEEVVAELLTLKAELPRSVVAHFLRIVERVPGGAMAAIRRAERPGGQALWHCSACNYQIRPQVALEIRTKGSILQCDSCRRFLFSEGEG